MGGTTEEQEAEALAGERRRFRHKIQRQLGEARP